MSNSSGKSRPPRLVHVTTVPQSLGFLRGQSGFMRRRGFEIEAISSSGPQLMGFGQDEGIPVHSVELPRRITPLHDLKALWELTRLLRGINPTIVHSYTPKGGLLGMISGAFVRVPVRIYHILGFPYMTATGRRRRLLQCTEWISCRLAHQVLCVSNSMREVAVSDGICPANKIKVVAGGSINGVDAEERFNPARFNATTRQEWRSQLGLGRGDLVIGYVGRIVRDKGIEELATAWATLRDDYPHARLVLVGPEEPQDPISPSVRTSLREDPRIVMTGMVDDTSAYYSLFDLVVLPTYREGFGNVCIEAAAMELPVVATLIPGCIDAIKDGVTGTLVPPRDAVALEEAIRMYVDDPALRHRHGLAGRDRVMREFRQEVIWEATYLEYCRLLEEKSTNVPRRMARQTTCRERLR